ncbi:branched-chain amino acid ABC transporter permease [Actinocorallia longicatena]|uniref:Branched-chain amino acid ABC transporter permease n=1 Tax=Actinocorallia longicatena TaxID=111803 RepID=A0ABP6QG38_9ACTN
MSRPLLHTSYAQDMALLDTRTKRVAILALLAVAAFTPLQVADDLLQLLTIGMVAAVGAIGLNIVTGYAGQISLGHAFFIAIGAYTGAAVSGAEGGRVIGLGLDFLPFWMLLSGLAAAVAGVIVAPLATRLRGLYLAIVTLGLVFLGEHVLKEWADLSGGPGVGRPAAVPSLFGIRLDVPGVYTREQKMFWLALVVLVIFAVLARNLVRSRIGRAFTAVRDRDIAASVIGVDVARTKLLAFAISSFYAGVAGSLLYTVTGFMDPGSFTLGMSIQYIAMILIGGAGTISGSILGALALTLLPRLTRELPAVLPFVSARSDEFPNVYQLDSALYGALIIAFLIFEPRGMYGLWVRQRNYWKGYPFSY